MYGIDIHPVYQEDISFKRVKSARYNIVFVKVSEGTSYVPPGLKDYVQRIKSRGFAAVGYYHFLDNSPGDKQAALFCKKVRDLGGFKGKVLIVDFETYGSKTPGNNDLDNFVAGVKKRFGKNTPVLLYSGDGFWNGGDSSGDASKYNVQGLWDARYADMKQHRWPRAYWNSIKRWYFSNRMWGGPPPPKRIAHQFTSAGFVGGLYVDVNRFFVSLKELKEKLVS
jgi:GH25 family lysozyme M1 (1,4-beta-N-acetylmuramidase)